MSRISRYQDSINNFFTQKSCIKQLSKENKNLIKEIYSECDHLASIVLLTVLNSRSQKTKSKLHAYYMASGIDITTLVIKINDRRQYFERRFGKNNITNLCSELSILLNYTLSQNIESFHCMEKDKAYKIHHTCIEYMTRKTYDCFKIYNVEHCVGPKKIDNDMYEFKDPNCYDKLNKIHVVKEEDLIEYTKKRYGSLCQLAIVLGWIMGAGDEKVIPVLEGLGNDFGLLFKIASDFSTIESDINEAEIWTSNIVVNCGIKDSFALFIKYKSRCIEGCLKFGLYTNTVKEVVDLIEKNIDTCLSKVTITLSSELSTAGHENDIEIDEDTSCA